MKIQSTCKCGSNFELECSSSERVWAEFRFREWQDAHKICRERIETKPHTPMWNIPYQPWTTPNTPIGNNCPKCGLKMDGVMGYVCPAPDCPTGLGPVMCKAGD